MQYSLWILNSLLRLFRAEDVLSTRYLQPVIEEPLANSNAVVKIPAESSPKQEVMIATLHVIVELSSPGK